MSLANTRKLIAGIGVFFAAVGAIGLIPAYAVPFGLGAFALPNLLVGLVALWVGFGSGEARSAARLLTLLFAILAVMAGMEASTTATAIFAASAVLTGYVGMSESRRATA